ncbi:TIGR02680 family protein [Candidatus Contubernalis alkaliaceticus]|uniref:TIGR02680 family protein n=1 Tax=Candidatus Contubernalis alkaliaceticus TaxID=338645 RepID=UPI001F4C4DD9|nr:TIGR02680 family protein [Candidatus Contubernalis alkalaceticus]UNC91165.1 TIGR02680 family protein [Candidatus Contubernalis alkalaceticus]
MNSSKWQLNRAGLLNFWYYDEEEFYFADGKLLLRGNNGSGKSVTMQSFIPVLLDGRKSPDRLDPFGSRSRKMEDYLLGEQDVVDRDERTGYLYLEYKRQGLEQYLTTGIGLRARRQGAMNFWGFILWDNRRIGKDLQLYKTEYSSQVGQEQKIPLTRQELENRLEQGGRVVRTQGEYMDLVNKHLFGFESKEAYEELIKLLIQLRSPKLSKDFRPTVIYEILNESLPSLSDEELRPLSDTIENMDQTKQQLDQLLKEQRSLKKLCDQYDQYNRFILAQKAEGVMKSHSSLQKLRKQETELTDSLHSYRDELIQLEKDMTDLRQEKEVLAEEEKALKKHDVFDVEREKIDIEKETARLEGQERQKNSMLSQKLSRELALIGSISKEENKTSEKEKEISRLLGDLTNQAEESKFSGHALFLQEFEKSYRDEYHFDLWNKQGSEHDQILNDILKVLQEKARTMDKYQEAERELGEARKELDIRRNEKVKWQDYFQEVKGELLTQIHRWSKDNQELLLSPEEIQLMAGYCGELYEGCTFEQVKEPMVKAYNHFAQKIVKEQLIVEQKIQEKEQEIKEKEEELQDWKRMKDPEPPRHPDTLEARRRLEEAEVPYLPFFAAVEFKPEVTPEERERIESAVTRMGLLDALIVPEKHLDRVFQHDRVIKPNPQILAYTLCEYLYPTPVEGVEVTASEINSVLSSVLVRDAREGLAELKEDGTYRLTLIQGHAPREERSKYIGKEARRKYRQQVIESLIRELESLKEQRENLMEKKNFCLGRKQKLEEEYKGFPSDRDAGEAYRNLSELRQKVKVQLNEVEQKNEKVKNVLETLQQVKERLRLLVEGMELRPDLETYEAACRHMRSYLESLHKLELAYKDFTGSTRMLRQYTENLKTLQEDIVDLNKEANELADQLAVNRRRLEKVEQRLQEMGAEEIRKRINRVEKRLGVIPDEMVQVQKASSNKESLIKNTEASVSHTVKSIRSAQKILNLWEKIFQEEYRLGLVIEADSLSGDLAQDALKMARKSWKEHGPLTAALDREKVKERLDRTYYQEHGVLMEYRLTQKSIFEVKVSLQDIEMEEADEALTAQLTQLEQTSRRIQMLLEYSGKRVSPYFVLEKMNKDIELQKKILSEKDRELYEEIIMNSVGRIIRSRISRAERWVKKIDELMAKRNTSSGLTFSLRWKPRTADYEEEMDTQDMVELLRMDPRLLKEQDMQRVTRHFRSKIERAKEVLEEKGYGETLHQAIKEMLDYRKWFSFILYYRKEREQKKELTNNVFYTFSGGEKAMAMYIPLFSAAYSRYLEARKDAPYIISLDEAFAGVDENNIRDMFDLIEKLGFNYIINSQSLWGDYDTVSALSICELVRPLNVPYVSVVRYHWNGKVRKLLQFSEEDAGDFTGYSGVTAEAGR